MYKISSNPQAKRSMEQMADGLLGLMEKDLFADITVLQICQEALVARKTFYRNFKTKDDVLDYALDRLMHNFHMHMYEKNMTLEKEVQNCYRYCGQHKKTLVLLHRNHLFHLLSQKLVLYLREVGCVESDREMDEQNTMELYFENFIASTITGVLELWVQNGCRETVDQLKDFTLRMLPCTE